MSNVASLWILEYGQDLEAFLHLWVGFFISVAELERVQKLHKIHSFFCAWDSKECIEFVKPADLRIFFDRLPL